MATTIKATHWTDAERADRDNELCEVVGCLQKFAATKYGEANIKRLRTDFLQGAISLRGETRRMMEALLRFEGSFLSAYIRQVCWMANSFWKSNRRDNPEIEPDDYIQEGCVALVNAVQHYDGSTAFTTLLHTALRRAMSCYVREQEERAGVGRAIKTIRRMVMRTMSQRQCSFEEAIQLLRKEGEDISDRQADKVADAMYKTIPLAAEVSSAGGNFGDGPIDEEEIQLAIDEAGLTDLERELVVGYMVGDSSLRAEMTRTRINPNTGNLYTKAALCLAFKRACDKMKDYLVGRDAQYAA